MDKMRNIVANILHQYILIIIALWVGFLILMASITGTSTDLTAQQKKHARLIGASYMTMNNEFYKIMNEQILERVEAEGDQLILRDPALSSERQIEQIEEMLDMGIEVLVLTPVDWESLTSVLKKAKAQGVHVVVVDSNVKDDELVDCTLTSDNYMAGQIVGEYFLTQCDSAKLVLLKQESAKSGLDRVKGFMDVISENDQIEIVKVVECEGQLEIAMPRVRKLIEQGIYFDSVFCLNDLAAVGAVAALDEFNMLDRVQVYGVDASPDAKVLIKEGMMTATAAQFPSKIGESAADQIYLLLDGEICPKSTLIPVELVNKDNVEKYGVERWQ